MLEKVNEAVVCIYIQHEPSDRTNNSKSIKVAQLTIVIWVQ